MRFCILDWVFILAFGSTSLMLQSQKVIATGREYCLDCTWCIYERFVQNDNEAVLSLVFVYIITLFNCILVQMTL